MDITVSQHHSITASIYLDRDTEREIVEPLQYSVIALHCMDTRSTISYGPWNELRYLDIVELFSVTSIICICMDGYGYVLVE
jgi:hypothetical protein